MKRITVIGAGHAGVQAAASLREEGFEGEVILFGDEPDLPYHKPPLSKAFMKDAAVEPQILRAEAFYVQHRIELALGRTVASLDAGRRTLSLADGVEIAFDAAVLAPGSQPRRLSVEGADLAGVLALRSVADARAIRALASQVADVVVIGGGFIGLELAATLADAGRTVTVIEAQNRLLARVVAPAVSAHVAERLAATGVRLLLGAGVSGIEGKGGRVSAVVTAAGERLPAGMVLVGIGAAPNVTLAVAAGLDIGNGIRVDRGMRTSAPDILAIGDAASFPHWQTGTEVRLESVQNATDQAKLAARILTGHDEDYAAVPWFWSDIGDMKLQMVGLTGGSDRQFIVGDPADNRFSIFHFAGARLVGIESVNRPADHMLGRRMIGEGFSPTHDHAGVGSEAVKAAYDEWRKAGTPAGSPVRRP